MGGETETGEEVAAELDPAAELDGAPPGFASSGAPGASVARSLARAAAPGAPPDGSEYLRRLVARPPHQGGLDHEDEVRRRPGRLRARVEVPVLFDPEVADQAATRL